MRAAVDVRIRRKALGAMAAACVFLVGCSNSVEAPSVEPVATQAKSPETQTRTAPVTQIGTPTTASLSLSPSELIFTADASISPSGDRRVAPSQGQWCLEQPDGVRCVSAQAEGSASQGVLWRPDESAIAVTWGAQDPISIIDFDAGTAVETDLDSHRLLAWSPDGTSLLGLDINNPGELSLIDPVSLEASSFAPLDGPSVPRTVWPVEAVVWGSDPQRPEVFTISSGEEAAVIEGGLGEQVLTSVSADGRIALTIDDDLQHGVSAPGATPLRLFDRTNTRSAGVSLPDGVADTAVSAAQMSADGQSLLVLHDTDDGVALSSAAVDLDALDVASWTTLTTWELGESPRPITFAANGPLRWDGGDTAWLMTETGGLFAIELT